MPRPEYDPDRFYTNCRGGCGFRVGHSTPKLTCWRCRLEFGIKPIPKPPQGDRAGWARYRELTAQDEQRRRIREGLD